MSDVPALGRWGREVEGSATLALTARAARLRERGEDVVALTAGEPDADPPDEAAAAVAWALEHGFTRYTPTGGLDELRGRVAGLWEERLGISLTWKNVLVSAGAKQACFEALAALLRDGDEVVIPTPAWVTYRAQVRMLGGVPLEVPTSIETGFKLTPAALEEALGERTRGLILNSPSNPTGAVYAQDELEALSALAAERGLWLLSDEIYDRITYGLEALSPVYRRPEIFGRAVVVNGISKSFALTGFRIGFALAPEPLIEAMIRIQSQTSGNPNSTAQVAAMRVLERSQGFVEGLARTLAKRMRFCVDRLRLVPHLTFLEPRGAFYIFLDARDLMARRAIKSDVDLCEALLREVGLALVPGSAFGTEGFVRLSFAASDEELASAMDRLERFVAS